MGAAGLWPVLIWAALAAGGAAAPAEPPPEGFRAGQYIDSRGCVFTRGDGGAWRPRLARDGSPICGYPPTATGLRAGPVRLPALAAPAPRDDMAARLAVAVLSGLEDGELVPADTAAAASEGASPAAGTDAAASGQAADHAPEAGAAEIRVTSRARPAPPPAPPEDDSPAAQLATLIEKAPQYRAAATLRAPGTGRLCALLGGGAEAAVHGATSAGTMGYCELTPLPFAARKGADRLAARTAAGARLAAPGQSARGGESGARKMPAPQSRLPAGPAPAMTRVILPSHRFVQVGTYRDPGNAARAAKGAAALGLPVRHPAERRGTAARHVVLAGPLADREAIVRALAALRAAGYRDAFSR